MDDENIMTNELFFFVSSIHSFIHLSIYDFGLGGRKIPFEHSKMKIIQWRALRKNTAQFRFIHMQFRQKRKGEKENVGERNTNRIRDTPVPRVHHIRNHLDAKHYLIDLFCKFRPLKMRSEIEFRQK